MSSNVLDQADALMRRRRFVAEIPSDAAAAADASIDAAGQDAIDDVPVLTDVVGDEVIASHAASQRDEAEAVESKSGMAPGVEQELRQRLNQLLVDRQAVLAQEIEAWLDEQMPQLVIRAMDGITDHLVSLLANRAKDELLPRLEAALKPLDAPEADPE